MRTDYLVGITESCSPMVLFAIMRQSTINFSVTAADVNRGMPFQ
jgi:hypothetical protein